MLHPMTIRIYHPETLEAFDVPVNKANELLLNHGWTKTKPIVLKAQPAAPEPVSVEEDAEVEAIIDTLPAGWRGSHGRRGRKPHGSDNAEA